MGIEDHKYLRGMGGRLLGALSVYLFGAGVLVSLWMMVPFLKAALPELVAEAEATGLVDQEAIMERFFGFIAQNGDLYSQGIYVASVIAAVAAALIFLPAVRRTGDLKSLYAPKGLSFSLWGLATIGLLGMNYLGSLALMGTEWLFNLFDLTILIEDFGADTPMYYIYAILIGPLAEEFIFRGGLFRGLKSYGERFALVASSVCFAFFHGNLNQFPGVFLMGLLLGYLCLRTDSLLPSTLTHMSLNALVCLIRPAVDRMPGLSLPILAAGLGLGLWAVRTLYVRLGRLAPEEPTRELRRAYYGSVPMLFFFFLCLYSIVSSVSPLQH